MEAMQLQLRHACSPRRRFGQQTTAAVRLAPDSTGSKLACRRQMRLIAGRSRLDRQEEVQVGLQVWLRLAPNPRPLTRNLTVKVIKYIYI
jgi:hypothetical protein